MEPQGTPYTDRMDVVCYYAATHAEPFLCHIFHTLNRERVCCTALLVICSPVYEDLDVSPL